MEHTAGALWLVTEMLYGEVLNSPGKGIGMHIRTVTAVRTRPGRKEIKAQPSSLLNSWFAFL